MWLGIWKKTKLLSLDFRNDKFSNICGIGFLSIPGLMPCLSKEDNVIACKLVSVYPQNSKYGISSHIVYVLLFDATTGSLLAFMVKKFILWKK